jgi:2-polyprenyl-3-methyl-5-hydroxy-6-metoxy-1,4-benzoquinol methylase
MTGKSTHDQKCLLCESNHIVIRQTLSASDILKCWERVGQNFVPAVTQPFLNEGKIQLYECRECGFQFFNPLLAGSAEFYEQLHASSSHYYAPDRPENQRNARFALGHGYRTVLDLGCGSGCALDAAKRAGLVTYGIELSRTAAAEATRKGHTIFPVLLDDLDPTWEGKFDLISLNQVLEHVPDPVELVRLCVRFLSPGGAIAIAVPNATGILCFTPWLQANWPPHHISRWKTKDFHKLAERSNLNIIGTGGDQLLGAEIQRNLLEHRDFCYSLQKPYHGLPPLAIKALCFFYRKVGLKYLFNSHGHSIYCYLSRKPDADSPAAREHK